MMEMTCSIVLYHNSVAELKIPIESMLKCKRISKIYLVDNSSNDDLRFQFGGEKIEYIFTGKNLGYGAGHNLAIRRAKGISMYHIVLNPDIEFDPDVLDGLFLFMQENTNVGLVMPKVLYRNGELQYLCKMLPSPADLFLRRFIPGPAKFLFKRILTAYELRHKDYNSIMEVPNLSGCFMFVRTEVFSHVGMFDERYFMYLEDTDLCRRINERYRTVYYPIESIIHGYARSSYKNFRLLKYHLNSSIRYFNKWGWFGDKKRVSINKSINQGISYYNTRHLPLKSSSSRQAQNVFSAS